ncbi:MAG TPA: alpha/beta hydrolase [Xanthobacteraceae bacterium]|nr:alpha/beta hydrolase [Xanthobacteraceae bacterium]
MSLAYRYYDAETLDRQYNARATVADISPFLQSYREQTAAARATLACHLGLRYGDTPPERLDVFPAAPADRPSPVFVYLHGGYWRLLDAADSAFMAPAFTQGGICVVAVNYALAPDVGLDEIVRQCRAALAWVFHHIGEFGGDGARVHVGGSSAGAHLAAMLIAPGWQAPFGLPEDAVAGATLLSGLYDLEPMRMTHVNEWLALDAAAAHRNSPLFHLPARPLPLVFSYAPNETDEFKRQTEIYLAACHAVGCRCEFVAMPGTNHFDLVLTTADPASPLTAAIFRTIRGGAR